MIFALIVRERHHELPRPTQATTPHYRWLHPIDVPLWPGSALGRRSAAGSAHSRIR